MATFKENSQEFLQSVYCPIVGVVASEEVEKLSQKNNLSFVELIQPFATLNTDIDLSDGSNIAQPISNFKLVFQDLTKPSPSSALIRKKLHDIVYTSYSLPKTSTKLQEQILFKKKKSCDTNCKNRESTYYKKIILQEEDSQNDEYKQSSSTITAHDITFNVETPWFEEYRKFFFETLPPSDHEFLKHNVACLLAVSTHEPDPIDKINTLLSSIQPSTHGLSSSSSSSSSLLSSGYEAKWFTSQVLKFFVLVHDASIQDDATADKVYQEVKNKFSSGSCHLLHINSLSPTARQDKPQILSSIYLEPNHPDSNPWLIHAFRNFNGDRALFNRMEMALEVRNTTKEQNPSIQLEKEEDSLPYLDHPLEHNTSLITNISANNNINNEFYNTNFNNKSEESYACKSSKGSTNIENFNNDPCLIPSRASSEIINRFLFYPKKMGCCLSESDKNRLKFFVFDFIIHALFPWVEKTLKVLNESMSNRKGLKGSILNVGKFFSKPKALPTTPSNNLNQQSNLNNVNNTPSVVYSPDSPEMQARKFADLCFLFHLYDQAYHTYHKIKGDFNSEGAWVHYSASLEMACLSLHLHGSQTSRPYPFHYMDMAIKHYFQPRTQIYAARAAMISSEILKDKGLFTEASSQFMTTTTEESDLLSGLLLEQAAICFLKEKRPKPRKYAFHMVLAGHRFNKASQKKHTIRCYASALNVFNGKKWLLAEDHMHLTMGLQSFNIKEFNLATEALLQLLKPHKFQPANQQISFFLQYLNIYQQQSSCYFPLTSTPLLITSIPSIVHSSILVTSHPSKPLFHFKNNLVSASGLSLDNFEALFNESEFRKLESEIYKFANSSKKIPINYKPIQYAHSNTTNNQQRVQAFVKEPLEVSFEVHNPLKVPVRLHQAKLVFRIISEPLSGLTKGRLANKSEGGGSSLYSQETNYSNDLVLEDLNPGENKVRDEVKCQVLKEIKFDGLETKKVFLTITARRRLSLEITGLFFYLSFQTFAAPPINKLRPVVHFEDSKYTTAESGVGSGRVNTPPMAQASASHYSTESQSQDSEPVKKIFGKSLLMDDFLPKTLHKGSVANYTQKASFNESDVSRDSSQGFVGDDSDSSSLGINKKKKVEEEEEEEEDDDDSYYRSDEDEDDVNIKRPSNINKSLNNNSSDLEALEKQHRKEMERMVIKQHKKRLKEFEKMRNERLKKKISSQISSEKKSQELLSKEQKLQDEEEKNLLLPDEVKEKTKPHDPFNSSYKLIEPLNEGVVPAYLEFEVKGKRLNKTKDQKLKPSYSQDKRLSVDFVPTEVKMEMYLENFPNIGLCGEVSTWKMHLVNTGYKTIKSIYLALSKNHMVSYIHSVSQSLEQLDIFEDVNDTKEKNKTFFIKKSMEKNCPRKSKRSDLLTNWTSNTTKRFIRLFMEGNKLEPGQCLSSLFRLHFPVKEGSFPLCLMVLYSCKDDKDEMDEHEFYHDDKEEDMKKYEKHIVDDLLLYKQANFKGIKKIRIKHRLLYHRVAIETHPSLSLFVKSYPSNSNFFHNTNVNNYNNENNNNDDTHRNDNYKSNKDNDISDYKEENDKNQNCLEKTIDVEMTMENITQNIEFLLVKLVCFSKKWKLIKFNSKPAAVDKNSTNPRNNISQGINSNRIKADEKRLMLLQMGEVKKNKKIKSKKICSQYITKREIRDECLSSFYENPNEFSFKQLQHLEDYESEEEENKEINQEEKNNEDKNVEDEWDREVDEDDYNYGDPFGQFKDLIKSSSNKFTFVFVWKALVNGGKDLKTVYGHMTLHINKPYLPDYCPPISFTSMGPSKIIKLIKDDQDQKPQEKPMLRHLKGEDEDILSNLVSISCFYSHEIKHDFKAFKSCVVSVEIRFISNCDEDLVLYFVAGKFHKTFNSSPPQVSPNEKNQDNNKGSDTSDNYANFSNNVINYFPSPVQKRLVPLLSDFLWIGRTKVTLILKARQSDSLKLKAMLNRPGVYDLNNFNLFACSLRHLKQKSAIDQSPPSPITPSQTPVSFLAPRISKVIRRAPGWLVSLTKKNLQHFIPQQTSEAALLNVNCS